LRSRWYQSGTEQVETYSAIYESAVVPERVNRAAIFSACRLELLLVRLTFGGEFIGLAHRSGIKDTIPST
jgi:hypothetical protein